MEQMKAFQDAVEEVGEQYKEKHGRSPISFVMVEIGGNSGRPLAGSDTKDLDQLGSIAVELIDADLRPYSSYSFVADLQDAVRRHPLVREAAEILDAAISRSAESLLAAMAARASSTSPSDMSEAVVRPSLNSEGSMSNWASTSSRSISGSSITSTSALDILIHLLCRNFCIENGTHGCGAR